MNIKILLVLNLVFFPIASAETVYKTFDAEGNIIFSDVPAEGAEEIEIKEAQILNIPEVKPVKYLSVSEEEETIQYSRLVISSPENDVTIHSNEGKVGIKIEIEPELFEEDVLVLFLDGNEVESGNSSKFLLSNLDRGTHTVNVVVKNGEEKVLKRSTRIVFHLRKSSKLFKKATVNSTGITTTPATENTGSTSSSSDIPVP